jgi:hypothetical protein
MHVDGAHPQALNRHLGTWPPHGPHLAFKPSELDARLFSVASVGVGVVRMPLDETCLHLPNELEVAVAQVPLVGCAKPLEHMYFVHAQLCPVEEADQHVHCGFDLAELHHVIVKTAHQADEALQKPAGFGNRRCRNLCCECTASLHELPASR